MERDVLAGMVERGLSSYQIASELNCSQTSVRYWLRKYDLKTNLDAFRKRYSDEAITEAVIASSSVSDVCRRLGMRPASGSHQHMSRRIKAIGIDTSHFHENAWRTGPSARGFKKPEDILIRRPTSARRQVTGQLRRAMVDCGVAEVCQVCSLGKMWNDQPLTLQIDHVDGDWTNDVFENLRFLCPNCHTQQETSRRPRKDAA
jgi:transposase-like protein